MTEITFILDAANKLTAVTLLALIAYGYFFGKVPTRAEVDQLEKRVTSAEGRATRAEERALTLPSLGELRRLELSEQRAWDQTEEAKQALALNTNAMERMADALAHLRDTVETVVKVRRVDG